MNEEKVGERFEANVNEVEFKESWEFFSFLSLQGVRGHLGNNLRV